MTRISNHIRGFFKIHLDSYKMKNIRRRTTKNSSQTRNKKDISNSIPLHLPFLKSYKKNKSLGKGIILYYGNLQKRENMYKNSRGMRIIGRQGHSLVRKFIYIIDSNSKYYREKVNFFLSLNLSYYINFHRKLSILSNQTLNLVQCCNFYSLFKFL